MCSCYLAASITWLSFTTKILDWRPATGGGGHDHDHGQEPRPRIFNRKNICNSIHTRIETVDITVTFHLLQLFLTSFRSIGLLLTSLEAGEDKSGIGETFQRAKSETWRKKREREREREGAGWGTCIWRTHVHACSTNFFLFFEFVASRYYPSTSQW